MSSQQKSSQGNGPLQSVHPVRRYDADRCSSHLYSPIENPFKSGKDFSIMGEKHVLPDPITLRPHVDTKAGSLDIWPAHTTGSADSTQVGLSKDKQLVLVDTEKLGKPSTMPKPHFLENLEAFLKKELKALGSGKVEASGIRLQVHREVFESLLEDFPAYRSLLMAIKSEYESMLSANRRKISHLEPLKQTLVSATEQCDRKLKALRQTDKPEIHQIKEINNSLTDVIAKTLEEQSKLKTEVDSLQLKLSTQYEHYRNEADARKLLVIDINELRYRQEDLLLQQQVNNSVDGEDALLMKIALRRARVDESAAVTRLAEMEKENEDVVPRRDVEALQREVMELKKYYNTQSKDMEILNAENETLIEVHKQVIKQKDEFYEETERLRRTATPRPDWEKCADFIPGGIQRWLELSDGHSSEELVEILLREIGSNLDGDNSAPEYFEGQGESAEVPEYLRFEGQVRNRHLGKRETAILIKDIWKEKVTNESEKGTGERQPMSSFLLDYLKCRFPLHQMVVEWCYNLHDSCQRFAHDEKIALFLGILTDEIDEAVYFNQIDTFSKLLGYLQSLEESSGRTGVLSKEMFKLALADFFGDRKNDSDVDAIVTAAEQELDVVELEKIPYTNLFLEDEEGKFGSFVDELKRQMEKEKVDYVADIMKEVDNGKLFPDDLQKAVILADPEIDAEKTSALLLWAFRCVDKAELDRVEPISKEELEQRLINGAIQRASIL